MFTPQPADFVDRVLHWIAHRRPTTLPAHMLATHMRPSVDSVGCVRLRSLNRAGSAATAAATAITVTSASSKRLAQIQPLDGSKEEVDCAPNPARVADTFDTYHDILHAMNVFGEKYHDELLASNHAPDL